MDRRGPSWSSRHVDPAERSHAPSLGAARIELPDVGTVGRATHPDRIPGNLRMPVHKQGWPSPPAVLLRQSATVGAKRVLVFILRINCLAIHDDLLGRIPYFTNG